MAVVSVGSHANEGKERRRGADKKAHREPRAADVAPDVAVSPAHAVGVREG